MYSDSDDDTAKRAHKSSRQRGVAGVPSSSSAVTQPRTSSSPPLPSPLPLPPTTSTLPPRSSPLPHSQSRGGGDVGGGGDSSSEFQSDEEYAWIPWYCSLKGNEFFCEVDEEYAQDSFNLTGLASLVPNFDQALDLILDVEPNPNEMLSDDQQEMLENDGETLFGLIHARYILTSRGMQSMLEKYRSGSFGRCPRVLCDGQSMLPIALSDQPNQHPVKLYCPRCDEIYDTSNTRHQHIDGAYFGTTFSHLFLLTYPELKHAATQTPKQAYVPRVFGFRIHKHAFQRALLDKNKVTTNSTLTSITLNNNTLTKKDSLSSHPPPPAQRQQHRHQQDDDDDAEEEEEEDSSQPAAARTSITAATPAPAAPILANFKKKVADS